MRSSPRTHVESATEVRHNTAGHALIVRHLAACEVGHLLGPALDLDRYADKLLTHADRFECWREDELAGLVAIYANDRRTLRAFVTMVSVVPACRGQRIASTLLAAAIAACEARGFEQVELDVIAGDDAIRLYRRLGFVEHGCSETTVRMTLTID